MPLRYEVRVGDCLSSIAFEHGFHPDTLWNHPDNAALRQQRDNPNVLVAGDVVWIPDLRPKQVPVTTGRVHRFVRRGVPETFRLTLREMGKPQAGLSYTLEVDGREVARGTLGEDGVLECRIPPNARKGILTLGGKVRHELQLGAIAPAGTADGARARLCALGLLEREDASDEALAEALEAFQFEQGLEAHGRLDAPTQSRLQEVFGC
ncbi:LysM peptidoglycan-binding domain-containing protein [Myxococcus sp. RHSTA-1-4]|uniref:LysM peptidoglycan-binding domain-containing protein n=1 Tax=Myxococcus sp. RHSTA-1-4 TaxID=2874601 RepID=UPI001CBEA28D|nr:LysM peptidoglycan-binding domain-containing protein [Myxococcus sp. RHSTA-1-4]MBZ4415809.1 LysM peptidoglycan-binding domain-containing protein [Myxococcus sp. RHSTA-1-4]